MRIGSSVGTMKIGSTAVAAIKRGTDRVYDADVAAFQKASAAVDVSGIMDLVDYLKAESLWNYARFYPMKSAQNAGTGSTVYGLGGLTSNNMTLVNSPTWGSDGVTFDGSTQCGTASMPAFEQADEVSVFRKTIPSEASASDVSRMLICCFGDVATTGVSFGEITSLLSGERLVLQVGTDIKTNGRLGSSTISWSALEGMAIVFQFGSAAALWKNKTSFPFDLASGGMSTSTALSPSAVGTNGLYVEAGRTNGGAVEGGRSQGVAVATLIYAAPSQLTTTQRETITDLINAL